LKIVDYKATTI